MFTRRLAAKKWATPAALLVLALAPPTTSALAGEEQDEGDEQAAVEPDYVNDAARLIHDGHHDRALGVLGEVDPNDPKIDKKRLYTLRAIAKLALEDHQGARGDLEAAVAAGDESAAIQLPLAQACFRLEDFQCTLDALSRAKAEAEGNPAAHLMKAESQHRLGEAAKGERSFQLKDEAIATLEAGGKRFSDKSEFDRIRIFYLIDLELYAAAAEVSRRYLERADVTEQDYVAIGEALRTARDFKGAQLVMEGARLRYPENEKIVVQLAHAYLDGGKKLVSAMLFEEAALLEPKYAFESAQLYKESGHPFRATWLNARIGDQKAKVKQRLSLLVDGEDFEAVTALEPKLDRLGLLDDQSVRYAVAYAAFKTGQLHRAEQHLREITEPELLESSLQLRKAIEACREAGWECSL